MAKNNYIFVCKANIHRSKAGEIVFKELCVEKGLTFGTLEDSVSDVFVDSAGVLSCLYGNQDSKQYIAGVDRHFDLVFAADTDIADFLSRHFSLDMRKLVDLRIPDIYNVNDEAQYRRLRDILLAKLVKYVPEKS